MKVNTAAHDMTSEIQTQHTDNLEMFGTTQSCNHSMLKKGVRRFKVCVSRQVNLISIARTALARDH